MSAVAVSPYAPCRYRLTLISVATLAFLGLLWLAAILEMKVECRTLNNCLGTGGNTCLGVGSNSVLGTGHQTRQCEISAWGFQSELSEQAEAILRKLGVRFF